MVAPRLPKKRQGGNPAFVATAEQRKLTMILAAAGHSQSAIAGRLSISVDTLQRHLKAEWDEGRDFANASVGEQLLKQALTGDIKAIDSWFDRRGGPEWRKITGSEQSGPGGGPIRVAAVPVRHDLANLSDEEIEALAQLTAKLEKHGDATAHE